MLSSTQLRDKDFSAYTFKYAFVFLTISTSFVVVEAKNLLENAPSFSTSTGRRKKNDLDKCIAQCIQDIVRLDDVHKQNNDGGPPLESCKENSVVVGFVGAMLSGKSRTINSLAWGKTVPDAKGAAPAGQQGSTGCTLFVTYFHDRNESPDIFPHLPRPSNAGVDRALHSGDKVEVQCMDSKKFSQGEIEVDNSDGTYKVSFDGLGDSYDGNIEKVLEANITKLPCGFMVFEPFKAGDADSVSPASASPLGTEHAPTLQRFRSGESSKELVKLNEDPAMGGIAAVHVFDHFPQLRDHRWVLVDFPGFEELEKIADEKRRRAARKQGLSQTDLVFILDSGRADAGSMNKVFRELAHSGIFEARDGIDDEEDALPPQLVISRNLKKNSNEEFSPENLKEFKDEWSTEGDFATEQPEAVKKHHLFFVAATGIMLKEDHIDERVDMTESELKALEEAIDLSTYLRMLKPEQAPQQGGITCMLFHLESDGVNKSAGTIPNYDTFERFRLLVEQRRLQHRQHQLFLLMQEVKRLLASLQAKFKSLYPVARGRS
jgi:hypothetical protein